MNNGLQTIIIYSLYIIVMFTCTKVYARRKLAVKSNSFVSLYFKPEIVLMILFFSFMAGIRYDVGTDHLFYMDQYVSNNIPERQEFLFRGIANFFISLQIHPIVYFGILAMIQVTFFFAAFKDYRYVMPFLVVFLFTNSLFGSWMNTIRQDIAICIWMFSIRFILQRKIWKYLVACAICIGFHRSSIIFILLYPIFVSGKDFFASRNLQITLYIAALVIRNNFQDLFINAENLLQSYSYLLSYVSTDSFYDTYTVEGSLSQMNENSQSVVNTGIAFYFKYFVYFIIILFSKELKLFYKVSGFTLFYNFFFIAVISSLIIPLGAFNIARPFQCFQPFLSVMLAFFCLYLVSVNNVFGMKQRGLLKIRDTKFFGQIILICFLGILFLSILSSAISNSNYKGYQLYFQQNTYKSVRR